MLNSLKTRFWSYNINVLSVISITVILCSCGVLDQKECSYGLPPRNTFGLDSFTVQATGQCRSFWDSISVTNFCDVSFSIYANDTINVISNLNNAMDSLWIGNVKVEPARGYPSRDPDGLVCSGYQEKSSESLTFRKIDTSINLLFKRGNSFSKSWTFSIYPDTLIQKQFSCAVSNSTLTCQINHINDSRNFSLQSSWTHEMGADSVYVDTSNHITYIISDSSRISRALSGYDTAFSNSFTYWVCESSDSSRIKMKINDTVLSANSRYCQTLNSHTQQSIRNWANGGKSH